MTQTASYSERFREAEPLIRAALKRQGGVCADCHQVPTQDLNGILKACQFFSVAEQRHVGVLCFACAFKRMMAERFDPDERRQERLLHEVRRLRRSRKEAS